MKKGDLKHTDVLKHEYWIKHEENYILNVKDYYTLDSNYLFMFSYK